MQGLKKTLALVVALVMILGLVPVAMAVEDVEGLSNEMVIKKLVAAGIFDLSKNNAFRPDDNVTRGELAKALVVAFNLKANGKAPSIADAKGDRNANYYAIAVQNGIMSLDKKGNFLPKGVVKKSDLIWGALYKATGGALSLDLEGVDLAQPATRSELADYLGAILGSKLGQTGIVKAVSKNTITLIVGGVDKTFLADGAYIFVQDTAADLSDIKKGNTVSFVVKADGKLGWLNAAQDMDYPTGKIALQSFDAIKVDYPWETVSDSSTMATDNRAKLLYSENEESWYKSGPNYLLGEIAVDTASLKVWVAGKELKVIPFTQEFDKAAPDDEVKWRFGTPALTYSLVFEKNPEKDSDLKVAYKKNVYSFSQISTATYIMADGAFAELNGKPVRTSLLAHRPVSAVLTLNMAEEVTYINAYYQDLNAKVEALVGNKLTIRVDEGVTIPFSDTVELANDVIVLAADGSYLTLDALKPNTKITLDTDPYEQYLVASVKLR